ncbi:hypothetical protein CE11_00085 [Megavirus courdo11]|uniref:Uncharacterized protein n=2 Tax=Megavirus TaxID=3044761 RepID=K7YE73_9VIRU|nr:hypothetical protein c7_L92 [Megavirus courdo7]AFX92117.1 hypothetical protein CE11_00085 [Megavirus courdo11]
MQRKFIKSNLHNTAKYSISGYVRKNRFNGISKRLFTNGSIISKKDLPIENTNDYEYINRFVDNLPVTLNESEKDKLNNEFKIFLNAHHIHEKNLMNETINETKTQIANIHWIIAIGLGITSVLLF